MSAKRLVLSALLWLVQPGSPAGLPSLELDIKPQVCQDPCHILVRVTRAPDDGDRELQVVIESPNYYRSSTVPLEGSDAPAEHLLEWRTIPGGHHWVSAVVSGPQGVLAKSESIQLLVR